MLKLVLDFLSVYWSDILIITLFFIGTLCLVKKGRIETVKKICFYLVCKAEQQFGSGTGRTKFAAVWSWLYEKLPLILRLIYTKKEIEGYIEQAVERLKEMLTDKNINLLSYAEEVEYELPEFVVKE